MISDMYLTPRGTHRALFTVCCFILLLIYYTSDYYPGLHRRILNKRTLTNNKDHEGETKACKPQRYVLFLKTHKTGSSTVNSLLNRYADKHNLTVIVPDNGGALFGWPDRFKISYAKHVFRPNFLINHARYSRKTMELVLPHDKTVYISVLRNPVATWESGFNYMGLAGPLKIGDKSDPISYFLEHLPSTKELKILKSFAPRLNLLKNPMFYDLGLDAEYFENDTMIRRAVNTIDKDFEFILIAEYMDESFTLLRRRFCWDIEDVVYFKTNERLDKHKRIKPLTEKQVEKIKEWNNADVLLYNFFVQKLRKQIENQGASFQAEVNELKQSRESYFKLCIEKASPIKWYSGKLVKGFQLRSNLQGDTKRMCERMVKTEQDYKTYFTEKIDKQIREAEREDLTSLYHIP